MKKIITSGFLIILVSVAGGCSLFKKDRVIDINNTKWSPTMLMTKNIVKDNSKSFIEFEDGKVHGNTGCNLIGGTYTRNTNGSLDIKSFLTRRMCKKSTMDIEHNFSQALNKVVHYNIVNGQLVFYSAGNNTIAKLNSLNPK